MAGSRDALPAHQYQVTARTEVKLWANPATNDPAELGWSHPPSCGKLLQVHPAPRSDGKGTGMVSSVHPKPFGL